MKDLFIEQMEKECNNGNHKFSEWNPLSNKEDERHCIYCGQTEYESH